MKWKVPAYCAAVGLLLCARAWADPVRVEDLTRHDELNEASMSPSGALIALAVPSSDGRETWLEIMKFDGSGKTQVLRFPQKTHVANVVWASDDQLVISRARSFPFQPRPASNG